jgi:hypothetical protein
MMAELFPFLDRKRHADMTCDRITNRSLI